MVRLLACGFALVMASGGASGQTAEARLRFEVASVKPAQAAEPGRGSGIRRAAGTRVPDPGLFLCESCTLTDLIASAFHLQAFQISGPGWMESERFDVNARVPQGTTGEQLRRMQQSLLEDRFHLAAHHEAQELKRSELVVAKGGPKLKPSPGPPAAGDGREAGANITPDGHVQAKYSDLSMDELAVILARQVRQPVTNATGLSGKFDFTLTWLMQAPVQPEADSGPDIFGALSSQLGLKL